MNIPVRHEKKKQCIAYKLTATLANQKQYLYYYNNNINNNNINTALFHTAPK